MVSLKLDSNNNLLYKNNFLTIDNQDAIIQDIKTLLLMFKSEYPFNLDEGLDWYNLASYNNVNAIKTAIKERILSDSRIKAINSLEVSFKNGKMGLSAELVTKWGIINV